MDAKQINEIAVQACIDAIDGQLEDFDEFSWMLSATVPAITMDESISIRERMEELKQVLVNTLTKDATK